MTMFLRGQPFSDYLNFRRGERHRVEESNKMVGSLADIDLFEITHEETFRGSLKFCSQFADRSS
jgi:hypothetical protein